MIRIVMDGMCEGCKCADLKLDYLTPIGTEEKEWFVRCIHKNACDYMETKTINRMPWKGEQNEQTNMGQ